jgi:hypothetical protein
MHGGRKLSGMAEPEHGRHWHYFGSGFFVLGAALLGIRATLVAVASPHPAFFNWYAYLGIVCFALAFACGSAAAVEAPFPSWPLMWIAQRTPRLLGSLRTTLSAVLDWSPITWRGLPDNRATAAPAKSKRASTSPKKKRVAPAPTRRPESSAPALQIRSRTPDANTLGFFSLSGSGDLSALISRGQSLAAPGLRIGGISGADSAYQWRADVEKALAGDMFALQQFRQAERSIDGLAGVTFGTESEATRRQLNVLEKILRDRSGGLS